MTISKPTPRDLVGLLYSPHERLALTVVVASFIQKGEWCNAQTAQIAGDFYARGRCDGERKVTDAVQDSLGKIVPLRNIERQLELM